MTIPHWSPPTHAMQIWRYAEQGSIKLLWISATNPAVSLPELSRIRSILAKDDLFVVVQDPFLTETAQYADVILPAAIWGEKTGAFTNVDRTVHLSEKAVEPPGEARSDLEIFLEYARRMDFRDKDGQPLIKWTDAEGAFEAWKACSKGRPCDYSGLSYDKLRGSPGVQWPCTEGAPEGTERIYTDGYFNTEPDVCETYGHDLLTGAANSETEYKALNPAGRAILHPAEYRPPHETPGEQYPLLYTTGRTLYHFHTRTKTGRTPQLNDAAPDVWVEVSEVDAERCGVYEGDVVRLESPRGELEARARVSGVREGVIFVPFHYGYFDRDGNDHNRAANELTLTEWDPVSKQPLFKVAAAKLIKVADSDGENAPAPTTAASAPAAGEVVATVGGSRAEVRNEVSTDNVAVKGDYKVHLANYLGLIHRAEQNLAEGFRQIAEGHAAEPDIYHLCRTLAAQCDAHAEKLRPFVVRYGENAPEEPERLHSDLFRGTRDGGLGLLRDLQDLYLMASECEISWTVIGQAAQGARDTDLLEVVNACEGESATQLKWLRTRMKQAAPQALIAA